MENIIDISSFIIQGAVISIKIYAVTILFAIPLGMLCAMGKMTKFAPLKWILELYTWGIPRNTASSAAVLYLLRTKNTGGNRIKQGNGRLCDFYH